MKEISLGKLEKLKIKSFTKPDRSGAAEDFQVMFNPESYSLSYRNEYNKKQGINTSGGESKYALTRPETLKLKIIIDGTGVNVYGLTNLLKPVDVNKEVHQFLKLTGYMDGDTHQPRYLTLNWGDLIFKCRLSAVQINYSLFDNSGIALRAELDTEFFGDVETSERLKKENKSSPDLTHIRTVKAGDRLPLMCEKIYGSAGFYLKVAKINKLRDFRNLRLGDELFFPPLE